MDIVEIAEWEKRGFENNDVGQQERERSCAMLSRQQYKEKQGSL